MPRNTFVVITEWDSRESHSNYLARQVKEGKNILAIPCT